MRCFFCNSHVPTYLDTCLWCDACVPQTKGPTAQHNIGWEVITISKPNLQQNAQVAYQPVVQTWQNPSLPIRPEKGTQIQVSYGGNRTAQVLIDPVGGMQVSVRGMLPRVS